MTLIREATLDDIDAIAATGIEGWREAYRDVLPAAVLASMSVDRQVRRWRRYMTEQNGSISTFVATAGATIVGFGRCGGQRTRELVEAGYTGEYQALHVRRAMQRHGLGRALITAMTDALSAAGHRASAVWVFRDNLPGRRFYGALGGDVIGEREQTLAGHAIFESRLRLAGLGGAAIRRPDVDLTANGRSPNTARGRGGRSGRVADRDRPSGSAA